MTMVGAVGRCRGVAPRSKISMMIMRPPQHGQVGLLGSTAAAVGLAFRFCNGEQLAGAGDVVGARAAGEQAVVADAVEACGQDVDQEAADELVGGERHDLLAIAAIGAIVLPPEGDAGVVAGDQPAVGDGDAVGVARQIGQHGLGSAERALGVDDPFGLGAAAPDRPRRPARRRERHDRRRTSGGRPCGRRRASPGTAGGTGARARARAGRSRAGTTPSACRRARCRRPARSCGRAGDGSVPSPRCAARR